MQQSWRGKAGQQYESLHPDLLSETQRGVGRGKPELALRIFPAAVEIKIISIAKRKYFRTQVKNK